MDIVRLDDGRVMQAGGRRSEAGALRASCRELPAASLAVYLPAHRHRPPQSITERLEPLKRARLSQSVDPPQVRTPIVNRAPRPNPIEDLPSASAQGGSE